RALCGTRLAASRSRIRADKFTRTHLESGGSFAARRGTLRRSGSRPRREKYARASDRRHPAGRSFSRHLSGATGAVRFKRGSAPIARPTVAARHSVRVAIDGETSPHGLESGRGNLYFTSARRHRHKRLLLLRPFLRGPRFEWIVGGN